MMRFNGGLVPISSPILDKDSLEVTLQIDTLVKFQ
jgi:hypothetical protein